MKIFWSLLGLASVLAACAPDVPPLSLSVSQDPQVLSGHWAGTLLTDTAVDVVGGGNGRVYALQRDVSAAGNAGALSELLVLDESTGAALNSVKGPYTSLAYRADGVLLATTQDATLELDPLTLQQLAAHPGASGQLSRDGSAVLSLVARTDTHNWTSQPFVKALEPFPGGRVFSSDGRWLQASGLDTQVTNLLTGVTVNLAPQHPFACLVTGGPGPITFDSYRDGVAVGYVDGRIELRDAQGQLQRLLTASGDCLSGGVHDLLNVGDTFVTLSEIEGEPDLLTTVDAASGQATRWAAPAQQSGNLDWFSFPSLTNLGVAYTENVGLSATYRRAVRFVSVGDQEWGLDREALPISLDAQTSYLDRDHYRSQGTVNLNGRTLAFQTTTAVQHGSSDILFRQNQPPARAVYISDLTDAQGVYGQLLGQHARQAVQEVTVTRGSDGWNLVGPLTR